MEGTGVGVGDWLEVWRRDRDGRMNVWRCIAVDADTVGV